MMAAFALPGLKAAREAAGMTQAQAAKALKVPTSRWSDWERGRQNPSPAQAERLAEALGADLASLMGSKASEDGAVTRAEFEGLRRDVAAIAKALAPKMPGDAPAKAAPPDVPAYLVDAAELAERMGVRDPLGAAIAPGCLISDGNRVARVREVAAIADMQHPGHAVLAVHAAELSQSREGGRMTLNAPGGRIGGWNAVEMVEKGRAAL